MATGLARSGVRKAAKKAAKKPAKRAAAKKAAKKPARRAAAKKAAKKPAKRAAAKKAAKKPAKKGAAKKFPEEFAKKAQGASVEGVIVRVTGAGLMVVEGVKKGLKKEVRSKKDVASERMAMGVKITSIARLKPSKAKTASKARAGGEDTGSTGAEVKEK